MTQNQQDISQAEPATTFTPSEAVKYLNIVAVMNSFTAGAAMMSDTPSLTLLFGGLAVGCAALSTRQSYADVRNAQKPAEQATPAP